MEKLTIKDRVNAMSFDTLTQEDFNFLVERALKSVRPASKSNKPTKAQLARLEKLDKVRNFVAEKGVVTCADVQYEFGISNQEAAHLLKDCDGLIKTPAKGKVKATWAVA